MRIKKYLPAFFTGFDDVYYDVNSKEELLASELCRWCIENGYEIEFSPKTTSCIMAVKKDRTEWWVLAVIDDPNDIDVLKGWLPEFSIER